MEQGPLRMWHLCLMRISKGAIFKYKYPGVFAWILLTKMNNPFCKFPPWERHRDNLKPHANVLALCPPQPKLLYSLHCIHKEWWASWAECPYPVVLGISCKHGAAAFARWISWYPLDTHPHSTVSRILQRWPVIVAFWVKAGEDPDQASDSSSCQCHLAL